MAKFVILLLIVFTAGCSIPYPIQPIATPTEPQYYLVDAPQNKPVAVGRPWGKTCEPLVFAPARGVPYSYYIQIAAVVQQARYAGLDVTLGSVGGYWNPETLYPQNLPKSKVRIIGIYANDSQTPVLTNGLPEHINFSWWATLNAAHTHEAFTHLYSTLYLKNISGTVAIDRAIRQLIGFSEGIAASTGPGSALADMNTLRTFTPRDIAMMRQVSGCHRQPPN